MYVLVMIALMFPVINGLAVVKIHRDSVYLPQFPCSILHNVTLLSQDSLQTCIWECTHERDCQTAVYFNDAKICSMFVELHRIDRILPSRNVRASVIAYQKSHSEFISMNPTKKKSNLLLDPIPTCPSTAAPEETTLPNAIECTTPRMKHFIGSALV